MEKGKMFVIEGACDGVGKSTQLEMLKDSLRFDGYSVRTHHFPTYGTNQGRIISDYLEGKFGKKEDLSPYFVNTLFAMDRAVTYLEKLKEIYGNGEIIVLDRYTTSSLIYQSALIQDIEERKRFIDYVMDFEYKKIGLITPDDVIFLDAPFELISYLRNRRNINSNKKEDIHEKDVEFMKKVYDNAHLVADYLGFTKVKCDNGKDFRKKEDIHDEIYEIVKKKLV